jgi:proline iminopeptidase
MDQEALAEIKGLEETGDLENPRYMELLLAQHYVHHVLRIPFDEWPEPVTRMFAHMNSQIYVAMQGPSELGISPDASLFQWDRTDDLAKINTPTLVMGSEHDTMDPGFLRAMAERMPNGRYHDCSEGSHCAMYDDQERYFEGLLEFLLGL